MRIRSLLVKYSAISFVILVIFNNSINLKASSILHHSEKQPGDTNIVLSYKISIGVCVFSPNEINPLRGLGYSYDFTQSDTRITSFLHNSSGFVIANKFSIEYDENPISPNIDFSIRRGKFNMIVYDSAWNELSHSWFRQLYILDAGIGIDIRGKYLYGGLKYRFGNSWGGVHNELIPIQPVLISNGRLNFITNAYHALELSLGVQYKNLDFTLKRCFPLNESIYVEYGKTTGLFTASMELGYKFNLCKLRKGK